MELYVTEISKYVIDIFMLVYVVEAFLVYRYKTEKKRRIAENALNTLRDFADGRGIRDGIVRTS